MAAAAKPPDFAPQVDEEDIEVSDTCVEIFFYSGYLNQVTTGDILDLASDEGGGDALDEADQLLEQLDLLSSD